MDGEDSHHGVYTVQVKFDVRPGIANLYHVYVPWQLRQSFLPFNRFFEMRMPM